MTKYIALCTWLLIACSKNVPDKLQPNEFSKKLTETREAVLIDVRTPQEYDAGHIPRAINKNIADDNWASDLQKLDKNKPYFVYCQRGGRSADAVSKMRASGFKNITELEGGYEQWKKAELETDSEVLPQTKGMTEAEYDSLINSNPLVLIDFSAKWCGPCKMLAPVLEKIARDKQTVVKIHTIDVDENEAVSAANSIEVLPTLALYKNGKIVWREIGLQPERVILNAINDQSK